MSERANKNKGAILLHQFSKTVLLGLNAAHDQLLQLDGVAQTVMVGFVVYQPEFVQRVGRKASDVHISVFKFLAKIVKVLQRPAQFRERLQERHITSKVDAQTRQKRLVGLAVYSQNGVFHILPGKFAEARHHWPVKRPREDNPIPFQRPIQNQHSRRFL